VSLLQKIYDDYNRALKSGDRTRVSILRVIRSTLKNREIEKGSSLNDEDIISVLNTLKKRAQESIEQFASAGRHDLVEKEEAELSVISGYLPEQLTEDALRDLIKKTIEETGASSPRDVGKVMKKIMSAHRGRVDGKLANKLVRELLGGADET